MKEQIKALFALMTSVFIFFWVCVAKAVTQKECGIPVFNWLKVEVLILLGFSLMRFCQELQNSPGFDATTNCLKLVGSLLLFGWAIYGLTLFFSSANDCLKSNSMAGWYVMFCILVWTPMVGCACCTVLTALGFYVSHKTQLAMNDVQVDHYEAYYAADDTES